MVTLRMDTPAFHRAFSRSPHSGEAYLIIFWSMVGSDVVLIMEFNRTQEQPG